MCHSATARSTHGVVVERAVFVTWNPPTTTRSRTRTGFVFCFSRFAVRDVLQYQRRPRRSPRRPLPESSAVSAVQLSSPEPEASLPDLPTKLILRVPASPPPGPPIAFASAVVRRLGQGRPPVPPGRPPSCFSECVPTRVVRRPCQGRPPSSLILRVSGVCRPPSPSVLRECLESVVRRPRHGRPPSPPGSPAKLVLRVSGVRRPVRVVRHPRQGRPPSSFCECQSAIRARPPSSFYECLESVVRRPRQGRPPSPPGSPAKLFLRVPKRRPRQGRPPSPPGSPAKLN